MLRPRHGGRKVLNRGMVPPTEGNTYVANWEKTPGGYRAWLKRRPKEKITGREEDELKEQLWEIALEAYGDGEACIELVPPLPAARNVSYFSPAWFKLGSNEGLHYDGDRSLLYHQGLCPLCKTGLGGRNEVSRVLPLLRSDFGFVWWENPDVRLVSAAFLKFFGSYLPKSARTIPCIPAKRVPQKFFELVLPADVSNACPADADDAPGRICPRCKQAGAGYFVCTRIKKGMAHGVIREDLLALRGSLHVTDGGNDRDILIDEKLAARLRKSKLKGVLLDRLVLIPRQEAGKYKFTKIKKGDNP